jgi:hypothetical protein
MPNKQDQPVKSTSILTPLLVIAAIVIISYKSCYTPAQPNVATNSSGESIVLPNDYPTTVDAYIACHSFIRNQLTNPRSADFPLREGTFQSDAVPQDTSYRVTGYVEHDNEYGATIKTNWYMRIQYKGGDKNDPRSWSVLRVNFD